VVKAKKYVYLRPFPPSLISSLHDCSKPHHECARIDLSFKCCRRHGLRTERKMRGNSCRFVGFDCSSRRHTSRVLPTRNHTMDGSEEEVVAAARIQAIQRGRLARFSADRRRRSLARKESTARWEREQAVIKIQVKSPPKCGTSSTMPLIPQRDNNSAGQTLAPFFPALTRTFSNERAETRFKHRTHRIACLFLHPGVYSTLR